MLFRKKIYGHILLVVYILVVLNNNVKYSDDANQNKTANSISHQHEDFEDIHHEHHFHVGVFHFLGHLFENINHFNDHADDHVVVVQKTSNSNHVDYNTMVNFFAGGNSLLVFSVDAESLPAPPSSQIILSHRSKDPNTPLRAPPSIV